MAESTQIQSLDLFRSKIDAPGPLWAAAAPGRLDLMGGIADYAGALVLEMPLDLCAKVAVRPLNEALLRVHRLDEGGPFSKTATFPLEALFESGKAKEAAWVRRTLFERKEDSWSAYVLGVLHQMVEAAWMDAPQGGLEFWLSSDVPWGGGVSSSAAIEVATLQALCGFAGIEKPGGAMALLAQAAENKVVGSGCGVMDQATSVLGRKGHLLCLVCKPCEVKEYLPLPQGLAVVGIFSGVTHSVASGQYQRVRAAADAGKALLQGMPGVPKELYLAELEPERYRELRERLPQSMTAQQARTEGLDTTEWGMEEEVEYQVRACVDHPVFEGGRIRQFHALLKKPGAGPEDWFKAGECMLESHRSYSDNCGLGTPETDWIVDQLMNSRGPAKIYGAKISGGGAGGTVVILCDQAALGQVQAVAEAHAERSGLNSRLFAASGDGALEQGWKKYE